jgi:putative transcriptional regulator
MFALLFKVVKNADRVTENSAQELQKLSKYLVAKPVIISNKRNRAELEHGAVYERHGIPIISPETLADTMLRNNHPIVYVKQGGIFVKLNSDLLRQLREAQDLSLGTVAEKLGVSRRSIYEYERGTIDPPVEKAIQLEDIFGPQVIMAISPFDSPRQSGEDKPKAKLNPPEDEVKEQAGDKLNELGIEVFFARYAPFDAIAKTKNKTIITCISQTDENNIQPKLYCVQSLSRVLQKPSLLIVEEREKHQNEVKGVAVLDLKQLDKLKTQKQLLKIIRKENTPEV